MQRPQKMARTSPPIATSPSTTAKEIDSVAAATCTKIQAEARKITIRLEHLNDNLICTLCNGYFLDAHKIKECAHTFCSGCIRDYFYMDRRRSSCPTCSAHLGPNPTSFLVADPAFQGIVDKLLPEFVAREDAERREFYDRHGFQLKTTLTDPALPTPAKPVESVVAAQAHPSDSPFKSVEKIAFELHPQNGPGIPLFLHLSKLKQPRMLTDASFRIHYLRKYLALKLKLSSPNKVEILCRGVTVGGEYSLAFVRRTIWDDAKLKMILEYRGTVV